MNNARRIGASGLTPATALVATTWLATLAATAWIAFSWQGRVMESLSTPQAQADWQEWKSAAQREATVGSPVQRRPVRGDEPPSLVIMRDYFGVVLAALLTVVSFLFAFLAFALRGSVRSGSPVDGASAETVK